MRSATVQCIAQSPKSVYSIHSDNHAVQCGGWPWSIVRLVLGSDEFRRRRGSSVWLRRRLVPRQRQLRWSLHPQPQLQITVHHSPHAHRPLQRYTHTQRKYRRLLWTYTAQLSTVVTCTKTVFPGRNVWLNVQTGLGLGLAIGLVLYAILSSTEVACWA